MSPTRTTGQRRASREQRREDLSVRLLGGIGRLAVDGDTFASASVERLTAAAGVGRSTFYLYFQDKTELLETWFAPIAADFQTIEPVWTKIDQQATPEDLKDVLAEVVEVYLRHALALPIIVEATAYEPVIRDAWGETVQRSIAVLTKQIRLGQREGWIGKDVLAREMATWLVLMTNRGASEMVAVDDRKRASLLDTYASVMHAALFGTPPGPAR